jgi:hypothetical protein
VTVVPTGIFTSAGPKLKLSILTEASPAGFSAGLRAKIGLMPAVSVKAVITVAAHMKIHLILFMCLSSKEIS